MNTLITGGHGLVGSYIKYGLKPTKKELNLLDYNNIRSYIEQKNIDTIIHCAAKVGGVQGNKQYMFDFFLENMIINTNIFRACKEFDIIQKALFLISTCAFPKNARLPLEEISLHEGEPHETNYGYAYAKRMIEVGSRSLKQQYNIHTNCLIPCNLYGQQDNYNLNNGHVIPSLIHKCYLAKINNTAFEIWGSGKAEREFIYAKDIADIIDITIRDNLTIDGPIIISPDDIFTIEQIVQTIIKIMQFKGKVFFDSSKPEGILKKNSSNKKFRQYFSNFKFTDLETGLALTIEYFLQNFKNIKK